jgi:hypothetical protein
VWFPGVGWVPSDPTAGATLAVDSATWFASAWTALGGLLGSARGRLLLAAGSVGLIGVGAAVAHLTIRRRSRAVARHIGGTVPRGPLPAAFGRFETALAAAGAPRLPSEGLEDLAARMPAAAAALAVVSRALYGAGAPSAADSRVAAGTLDRLSASLLAGSSDVRPMTRP